MASNNTAYYKQRDKHADNKAEVIIQALPSFVKDFIDYLDVRETSALTRLGYAHDLKIFFDFLILKGYFDGISNAKDITPQMLETLKLDDFVSFGKYVKSYQKINENGDIETVNNSGVSISRKYSAIRALYTYLVKNSIIEKNASEKIVMPKHKEKSVIYLDTDGINELFDSVNSGNGLTKRQQAYNENFRRRDIAIMYVLIGTGIRESELIGLDFNDVNLAKKEIRVMRKGHNEALIKLPDSAFNALMDYIKRDREKIDAVKGHENAVFLSSQRKRLSARALQDIVGKYARAANLHNFDKIKPHKLRASYASNLLKASENFLMVSKNLGHRQLQTTLRYIGGDESYSDQAAEIAKDFLPDKETKKRS